MSKVILTTTIPRAKGMLYFCGTDSKGNLCVCEAVMSRGGKSKKKAKK
jgi:hypothetical protein